MASINKKSEVENLSRIRDILFGEDLESIEQKLGVAKDESELAFEKLKNELNNSIKDIGALQKEKFKELDERLKSFDENQNSIIDEIKQEIVNIENTFNENIEKVSDKISNVDNAFNEIVKQLKDDYDNNVKMLSDSKIDKKELADMLTEIANKLNK